MSRKIKDLNMSFVELVDRGSNFYDPLSRVSFKSSQLVQEVPLTPAINKAISSGVLKVVNAKRFEEWTASYKNYMKQYHEDKAASNEASEKAATTLRQKLDAKEQTIATLKADLEAANKKIAKLEKQLDTAKKDK